MAIPKKIHYVWVGTAPIPEQDQKFIKHWQELNPDFKIKRWTEKDIDTKKYPLVAKAISEKRWALASDIIRMYAIYTEGGFYFDTDVELLKPLDDLLKYDGFASWESNYWFTTSGFGAKKHSPWIEKVLKRYEGYLPKKITNSVFMSTVHSPSVYAEDVYGLKLDGQTRVYDDAFAVFAPEYFNPKHYSTGEMHRTKNTRAIHHYASTWHSNFEKFAQNFCIFWIKLMGPRIYGFFERIYHGRLARRIRDQTK
ncbi:hypothetical protein IKQ74_01050 [Candidatus Saccharibacteria bacterium]|jgi:mannosyltransferase OCH1-like enzyme|nr:hypothetical protein [Candidatus Saccharibacteria bacterium]